MGEAAVGEREGGRGAELCQVRHFRWQINVKLINALNKDYAFDWRSSGHKRRRTHNRIYHTPTHTRRHQQITNTNNTGCLCVFVCVPAYLAPICSEKCHYMYTHTHKHSTSGAESCPVRRCPYCHAPNPPLAASATLRLDSARHSERNKEENVYIKQSRYVGIILKNSGSSSSLAAP